VDAAADTGPLAGPRIAPGTAAEIGRLNFLIARLLGAATGGGPPHIFTTLALHRGLFRRWLAFAGALMPGGRLPRIDSELLILRTAHTAGCTYEWSHHTRLGAAAGLTSQQVDAVRLGPSADGWSARQRLLLRAADELLAQRGLSDETWAQLREVLRDAELIELCMLVGHYEMLGMTLNALRVEPDALPAGTPPLAARLLQRLAARRGRRGR
jgi:AhpD family alkylhydroperoxidase